MKANVVLLTPSLAKKLLKQNVNNRKLKESKFLYAREMKAGRWKENGESIIIDKNGNVKDGQHRLYACINADYSFYVVLVTDVDPNVMQTIDVGVNRSAADILKLNNFKYTTLIPPILQKIKRKIGGSNLGNKMSNAEILDLATKHEENIYSLCKITDRLYANQKFLVLARADVGAFLYLLSDSLLITDTVIDFMEHLLMIKISNNTACSYVFDKLLKFKENGINVSPTWKYNAIVKAYNSFVLGNPEVKYLKINGDSKEKILHINPVNPRPLFV